MPNEPEITEIMNSVHGGRFSRLVKEHQCLQAIWENCFEPDIVLDMLRHSNYRQDYFEELCEFNRWLFSKRKIHEAGLPDFDEYILDIKAKFESGTSNGQLLLEPFDAALLKAEESVIIMTKDAAVYGAFWDPLPSRPPEEIREVMKLEIKQQSGKVQSQKLRELIPNPFLPNIK